MKIVNLSLKDNLHHVATIYIGLGGLAGSLLILVLGLKHLPFGAPDWLESAIGISALAFFAVAVFLVNTVVRESDRPIKWMRLAVSKGEEVKIRSVMPTDNWVPTRRWLVVIQHGDDPYRTTLVDTTADCRYLRQNYHYIWDGRTFVDRKKFSPTVDKTSPDSAKA